MKKIKIVFLASIIAVMLSGCTMPGWWNSARRTPTVLIRGILRRLWLSIRTRALRPIVMLACIPITMVVMIRLVERLKSGKEEKLLFYLMMRKLS